MKLNVKFCPNCGSRELRMIAAGEIGMRECLRCGYRGSIFPEKEIEFKKKKSP